MIWRFISDLKSLTTSNKIENEDKKLKKYKI